MSKREVPDNFMDNMLAGKRGDELHATDTVPTTDAQTTDTAPTPDRQGPTPRRQVRIGDHLWAQLVAEAARRQISTSALVRQILVEYLRRR